MLFLLLVVGAAGWYLHVQSLKADIERLKTQTKHIQADSNRMVKDLQIAIKLYNSMRKDLENK